MDSSSEVTLLWQSYFNKHILPKIKLATGEKADVHTLDKQLPMMGKCQLECTQSFTFLGLKVPNVGVLIAKEPNQVLDKEHHTKPPGIVGWNLIWLSYNMFNEKYGTTGFDSFICSEGVKPLLFSNCASFTILTYKRTKHWEQHLKSCPNKLNITSPQRQLTCLKIRPINL